MSQSYGLPCLSFIPSLDKFKEISQLSDYHQIIIIKIVYPLELVSKLPGFSFQVNLCLSALACFISITSFISPDVCSSFPWYPPLHPRATLLSTQKLTSYSLVA